MMHESETFEWNDVAPQLLFPIDYTSKEIERKFARDSRGFRNHVLKMFCSKIFCRNWFSHLMGKHWLQRKCLLFP